MNGGGPTIGGTVPPARGRFIVFEGGEGSGKSTQAALLAGSVGARLTHQPGGTAVGAALRAILLEGTVGPLADRAEALLMAADRAQHVAEVVDPLLIAGTHVVCDRYLGSSVAYQGYGRGLDPGWIRDVSLWATEGLTADLVVLLDVDEDVAAGRVGQPADRIEAEDGGFHRRVREGFLAQAGADPQRWVVIDGSGSVDAVHAEVVDVVRTRLGLAPG